MAGVVGKYLPQLTTPLQIRLEHRGRGLLYIRGQRCENTDTVVLVSPFVFFHIK